MHDTPHSARLAYRRMAPGDVEAAHRHWNEPLVRRFLWDDAPVSLATVQAVQEASTADFARAGYGLWMLRDDAAGSAGVCGLRAYDSADVELLYSIDPARWGRGLATEAARAVLLFAFTRLGLARVLGGVDEPNVASRRVLEKVGMTDTAPGTADRTAPVRYLALDRARGLATLA